MIPLFAKPSPELTRRDFFQTLAGGIHGAALAWLWQRECASAAEQTASPAFSAAPPHDTRPRTPHTSPPAKAVIHLFMNGGPSQMDLFDPKPELDRHHGEKYFDKIAGEVENPASAGALFRSPFQFAQHGGSGIWMSELLPYLSRQADDIALVRSLFTTNITHEPAIYIMQTGKNFAGRPALGSWVVYGLGSENQNLPAYVVLDDPLGLPINGVENWQAGFLPPVFQGTRFRATGSPVLNLQPDFPRPPALIDMERRLTARLDRIHEQNRPGQPNLHARIASYELAARMQLEAADALNLAEETRTTLEMYGIGREPTDSYGRRCLIARRLVERGVRFVQLYINGQIWDTHTNMVRDLQSACGRTDQPVAALLRDLRQRGLLDETLVIWGGEFGRLPIAQLPPDKNEKQVGRDHNKNACCAWLAGGGVRGGLTYGSTDDLGFAAVEDRVSVPDWHATILNRLGLHHEGLFLELNGLRERLTGVTPARVVQELFA